MRPPLRLHFLRKKWSRRLLVILITALVIFFVSQLRSRKRSPIECNAETRNQRCPQPAQCKDTLAPVATPRPLVIVSAGATRASSTFLFNALRILLRIRDPNTVSGWYSDLIQLYDSYAQSVAGNGTISSKKGVDRVNAFKTLGTVLIKIHTVRDWHIFQGGEDVEPVMEDLVDGVFTTHRDLRYAVRSIRDMGWGTIVSNAQRSHANFCRKQNANEPTRFFKLEDYEREETWVNIALNQVRCREVLLETAGKSLRLDLRAEDIHFSTESERIALLKEISASLDFDYDKKMLEMAARELSMLRPLRCNSGHGVEMTVNPVTHMHKGHVRGGGRLNQRGVNAISKDKVCAEWLQTHLYPSAADVFIPTDVSAVNSNNDSRSQ